MRVLFRADASPAIGVGHVMRCSALARALQATGATVTFACQGLPDTIADAMTQAGYHVHHLASGEPANHVEWSIDAELTRRVIEADGRVSWIVVDHYDLPMQWERYCHVAADRIMAIDDLLDRRHDCDILLVQNLYPNAEDRYGRLVPVDCVRLFGPQYALLRPEFRARRPAKERLGRVGLIQVSFGGADARNETQKAIKAISMLKDHSIDVDVVVGPANTRHEEIVASCLAHPQFRVHTAVPDMARLMAAADLAIGGAGTSMWERCCLGLPAIVVAVADNEVPVAEGAHAAGAVFYAGRSDSVSAADIATILLQLLESPSRVSMMSRAALQLADGLGVDRVVAAMRDLSSA